jgi:glycosyltransferase involved in cell wall biosynthesis
MTLKICHLISGDLWAGAEVMAFHLLNGLKTLPGLDLFVILLNQKRLSEELEKIGIPVYVIDESKRSFPVIVRMAARIVRKQAPQIIHSHRYKENILSNLISITLKKDVALISTQHGMPESYDGSPSLVNRLKSNVNYRLLASRFDKVVAVSLDIKDTLVRDYGFQEKRVQVIRNGIVVPDTPRDSTAKDDFVIGSAGRFFPVKGYPFMIEVAREVITKNNKFRFELAGEGPMLGDIQGLIQKYGLEEHFVLRGFLYDMSIFYQGLDVYLNTSLHEGIPMSVLEAMACRIPTIAPKVGGLREIVTDGVDGYLLNARNPKDFADRCLSLYENETLRQKMAHAAREKIIREFSIQWMVENYTDIYMQIIRKNEQ